MWIAVERRWNKLLETINKTIDSSSLFLFYIIFIKIRPLNLIFNRTSWIYCHRLLLVIVYLFLFHYWNSYIFGNKHFIRFVICILLDFWYGKFFAYLWLPHWYTLLFLKHRWISFNYCPRKLCNGVLIFNFILYKYLPRCLKIK